MAAVIKLKRGTSTPSTSDIANGEVAVDTSAAKLYINDSGTVKEIGGGGGGGVTSDAQRNTVAGTNAGDSFDGTNATDNTILGYDAGTAITTADFNVVIGSYAGLAMTSDGKNTLVGYEAGKANTNEYNTYIGYQSGLSNTGAANVYLGCFAGKDGSGKANNTAVGYRAGRMGGQNSIYLGREAGGAADGTNNILIGYGAVPSSNSVDNEVTLGNSDTTKFRIPGLNFVVKDTTATEDYVLTVDANGEAGWEAAAGGTPTAITVADESSDTTCFPLFATAATGDLGPKSGSNLTFNSSTGALAATLLNGGAGDDLSLDFGSVA